MRYTVYKTTNTENGRFYVGVHRTEDPHDSYLGSGNLIKAAIKKYGREAFTKEVLYDFDTVEEMEAKESEIVDASFVDSPETYNLVPGGYQGNAYYQALSEVPSEELSAWCQKGNEVQRQLAAADPTFRDPQREAGRRVLKRLHAEGRIPIPSWEGRKHTEEAKANMRAAKAGHGRGKRNSQHGTAWVCREGETPRKIKMADLPSFLEAGWQRGRKVRPKFMESKS